jgi:hypothetical protein
VLSVTTLRVAVASAIIAALVITTMTLGVEAGTDACDALHASYTVTGSDGNSYPTWHPPSAALPDGTVCHFGHEHGSDPALFAGAASAQPVGFGRVDQAAGQTEPHVGFKVFVVQDDGHGLSYRIVLHQGTGHGRRALVQYHEVQFAVADARTGDLLADTAALADFGHGEANCAPNTSLQPNASGAAHQHADEPHRAVPTTDCATITPYESWRMAYRVAGSPAPAPATFTSGMTFDVDDPETVFDPSDPERLVYLCAIRPSRQCNEPDGTQTAWKGTRRGLVAPTLVLSNAGPDHFTTDVFGGLGQTVSQFVTSSRHLDFSTECCGPGVVFKERDGVYVLQAAGGPTFSDSQDDGTVHWPN